MTQQSCSKPQVDRVRLASYLTVSVAGGLLATATSEAAIVMIDLTNVNGQNITGANAGVANGNKRSISDWLGAGTGKLDLYNNFISTVDNDNHRYFGLEGDLGLQFAVNGTSFASPRNFGAGTLIDSAATFSGTLNRTVFLYETSVLSTSPDFGAGSFMAFRFGSSGNFNYGYLEVLWNWTGNPNTSTFQILGGAYESTVNTGILAGATAGGGGGAVPVPAASLLALMALGGNSFRRSRARAA